MGSICYLCYKKWKYGYNLRCFNILAEAPPPSSAPPIESQSSTPETSQSRILTPVEQLGVASRACPSAGFAQQYCDAILYDRAYEVPSEDKRNICNFFETRFPYVFEEYCIQ